MGRQATQVESMAPHTQEGKTGPQRDRKRNQGLLSLIRLGCIFIAAGNVGWEQTRSRNEEGYANARLCQQAGRAGRDSTPGGGRSYRGVEECTTVLEQEEASPCQIGAPQKSQDNKNPSLAALPGTHGQMLERRARKVREGHREHRQGNREHTDRDRQSRRRQGRGNGTARAAGKHSGKPGSSQAESGASRGPDQATRADPVDAVDASTNARVPSKDAESTHARTNRTSDRSGSNQGSREESKKRSDETGGRSNEQRPGKKSSQERFSGLVPRPLQHGMRSEICRQKMLELRDHFGHATNVFTQADSNISSSDDNTMNCSGVTYYVSHERACEKGSIDQKKHSYWNLTATQEQSEESSIADSENFSGVYGHLHWSLTTDKYNRISSAYGGVSLQHWRGRDDASQISDHDEGDEQRVACPDRNRGLNDYQDWNRCALVTFQYVFALYHSTFGRIYEISEIGNSILQSTIDTVCLSVIVTIMDFAGCFENADNTFWELHHGTGLHLLLVHNTGGNPASRSLRPYLSMRSILKDLDPRMVEMLKATFLSWLLALTIFCTGALFCHAKKRFRLWWNYRIGRCRHCSTQRICAAKPTPSPKIKIGWILLFGWLMISPGASIPNKRRSQHAADTNWGFRTQEHTTSHNSNKDTAHPVSWNCTYGDIGSWTDTLFVAACDNGTFILAKAQTPDNKNNNAEEIEESHSLMQTTTQQVHEVCAIHQDPLLYWDKLSIRPPLRRDRFIVWITDPRQAGQLQAQPLSILWDGMRCIRCVFVATTPFRDLDALKGPFLVRPTPDFHGISVVPHFIVLTAPKNVPQRVIHVRTQSSTGTSSGTLVLDTLNGLTTVQAIFDAAKPGHRCSSTSWCRIGGQHLGRPIVYWWPSAIGLTDYAYVELDELDPPSVVAVTAMTQQTIGASQCPTNNPDSGSTAYHQEGDETSTLSISSTIERLGYHTSSQVPQHQFECASLEPLDSIDGFLPYGCNASFAFRQSLSKEGKSQWFEARVFAADEVLICDDARREHCPAHCQMPQEHHECTFHATRKHHDEIDFRENTTITQQSSLGHFETRHQPIDQDEHGWDLLSFMHMPRPEADRSRSGSPATASSISQDDNRDRATSSCSSGTVSALVVYGKSIETELIPTEQYDPPDRHRAIVANHFGIFPGTNAWEAVSIHYVQPRPPDLAPCVTPVMVRFQGEHDLSVSITLIDIHMYSNMPLSCQDAQHESTVYREVWELPVLTTRSVLLHRLGLSELCHNIALPCIVQFGMHPWHLQDPQPYPILDGIFIQVKISIPEPDFALVHYLEYARQGVPFANMLNHFQQQMAAAAARVAGLFESDDEALQRSARDTEHLHSDDMTSLLSIHAGTMNTRAQDLPKNTGDKTSIEVNSIEQDEMFCLMATNRPQAHVSTHMASSRQFAVIYESDSPPLTVNIDPSLSFSQYRHAIGTLVELEVGSSDWDNFAIYPVRPRPPHLDPLTHEAFIFAMPGQIKRGFVQMLVRLQLFWDDECPRTEEHSQLHVLPFPIFLDRESFLVNAFFRDICHLTGTDQSEIFLAGALWPRTDLETKYVFDGMFATIRCPSPIRHLTLSDQITGARLGRTNAAELQTWRVREEREIAMTLLQTRVARITPRSPTFGLPPPGNGPTHVDLETMDQVSMNQDGIVIVSDWKSPPVLLELANLLRVPTPMQKQRFATPKAGFEPKDAQQHMPPTFSVCLEQKPGFFEEILHFEPEDMQPQTDWQSIPELLPCVHDHLGPLRVVSWFDWMEEPDEILVYTDGSFDGKQTAWACLFLAKVHDDLCLLGFFHGQARDGVVTPGAMHGENLAIQWATLWLLRYLRAITWRGPVTFFWDAKVAGHRAAGDFQIGNDDQAMNTRFLQQAIESYLGMPNVQHQHVKAHSGVWPNEFVDAAAKAALNDHAETIAERELAKLAHLPPRALTWLWLHVQSDQGLPCFDKGSLTWQRTSDCSNLDVDALIESSFMPGHFAQPVANQTNFDLRIATYNCLSLGTQHEVSFDAKHAGIIGQVPLLRNLAHELHLNVIGLQECRTEMGIVQSATHLRICSGADDQSCFGVELWIDLRLPYAWNHDGTPILFRSHLFAVVHSSPRVLIVNYSAPELPVLFVVGHAPHEGHGQEVVTQWWHELQHLLEPFRSSDQVHLLDANARISGAETTHFGDLKDGPARKDSSNLREHAERFGLIAPSTFSSWHWGTIHTWTHPNGRSQARLDYILIPLGWSLAVCETYVDETFRAPRSFQDHSCVVLALRWSAKTKHQEQSSPKLRFDVDSMTTAEGKDKLTEIWESIPTVPWNANATVHAHEITAQLQHALREAFPRQKRMRHCTIASTETMETFHGLMQCKRQFRTYKTLIGQVLLRFWFDVWREVKWDESTFRWTAQLFRSFATFSKLMPQQTKRLTRAIRQDRRAYIERVAAEAQHAPPHEIYRALRPIMPTRKASGKAQKPLPRLTKLDGTTTSSIEEVDKRWAEHFATLEGGREEDPREFILNALNEQQQACMPSEWSFDDLPSLTMLENAIQRMRCGRASGPDQIPAELFRACPRQAARHLMSSNLPVGLKNPFSSKGGR